MTGFPGDAPGRVASRGTEPAHEPVDGLGEEAPIEVEFEFTAGDATVRYVVSPRLTRN